MTNISWHWHVCQYMSDDWLIIFYSSPWGNLPWIQCSIRRRRVCLHAVFRCSHVTFIQKFMRTVFRPCAVFIWSVTDKQRAEILPSPVQHLLKHTHWTIPAYSVIWLLEPDYFSTIWACVHHYDHHDSFCSWFLHSTFIQGCIHDSIFSPTESLALLNALFLEPYPLADFYFVDTLSASDGSMHQTSSFLDCFLFPSFLWPASPFFFFFLS